MFALFSWNVTFTTNFWRSNGSHTVHCTQISTCIFQLNHPNFCTPLPHQYPCTSFPEHLYTFTANMYHVKWNIQKLVQSQCCQQPCEGDDTSYDSLTQAPKKGIKWHHLNIRGPIKARYCCTWNRGSHEHLLFCPSMAICLCWCFILKTLFDFIFRLPSKKLIYQSVREKNPHFYLLLHFHFSF